MCHITGCLHTGYRNDYFAHSFWSDLLALQHAEEIHNSSGRIRGPMYNLGETSTSDPLRITVRQMLKPGKEKSQTVKDFTECSKCCNWNFFCTIQKYQTYKLARQRLRHHCTNCCTVLMYHWTELLKLCNTQSWKNGRLVELMARLWFYMTLMEIIHILLNKVVFLLLFTSPRHFYPLDFHHSICISNILALKNFMSTERKRKTWLLASRM